jgi:hypothetical protein
LKARATVEAHGGGYAALLADADDPGELVAPVHEDVGLAPVAEGDSLGSCVRSRHLRVPHIRVPLKCGLFFLTCRGLRSGAFRGA